MKNFTRTLACKVICFIMCIVFLCISAASIAGAAVMIGASFYVLPKEYVIDSVYEDMLRSNSNNVLWHHVGDDEYHYYSINDYESELTNIRYNVVSPDGEVIGANSDVQSFDFSFKWIMYKDENGEYTVEEYYFDSYEGVEDDENADIYTVNMTVDRDLSVNDEYFFYDLLIDLAYALLYWIYPIGLLSLALSVTCFIILMSASARRPGSDGVFPGALNRVPIDLLICLCTFLVGIALFAVWEPLYSGEILGWVLTGVVIVLAVNLLLGLCMSIAARIKQHTLFSNTLVWIVLKLLWKICRGIFKGVSFLILSVPLIWKTCLFLSTNLVIDFLLVILADSSPEIAILLWVLKSFCIVPVIIYAAIMLAKLERGGRAIAGGDTSFRINTRAMIWDFRRHGENLNSISEGMSRSVEERLKSERMKTELITNVSHDIKTPLTSIINYSGLISEEDCGCEKHREYSEVLVRKSEHLKRLLDDLVEVSKATTGNMSVSLSPCEAGVLLSQVAGEFEERCRNASLELITSAPEAPVSIMADSRRIWRVFENLMSNACKYSLEGSRVYLSLEKEGKEAAFIFRNTSKAPLNVSPDELSARFVRGDSSRSTEGNGLGLSIAKSLTELQGGRMDIVIDGDLFKVVLRFPTV